ncbi:Zn(II)2Cys6 transcription factor [Aspergillus foveolatus]|uniref:Zn(II)2Cys6 transcription factor n=1 Tax=Aspergillus foveolatus TaxID=210207 RepID=UPI003CCCD8A2
MVGVPRSKGCLRCISRRVKCDESRPACMRCTSHGSKCPGYNRGFKFQDQTRSIAQRHGRTPIDEAFTPNLAQQAIDLQTQELFDGWLKYHFPIYAASFNCRVDVDWMGFIRDQWSAFPQALVWAVRALTCLHRGATQGDKQAIMCARHMYGRGIRHLVSLLQTRAALSDKTLAAAILLGGYEILDGSSEWSWITHSRGISYLFCARGPAAHRRGMGRTLMLCWRPYIVADAFIHAVPCFLGDYEWASILMSEEVARAEEQEQKGSLLGQTMDYAFIEVAKCPGYLAATKIIEASNADSDPAVLKSFIDRMLISRENLVKYNTMLETNDPPVSFVGVIPAEHARTLVLQSRDGIKFAIALINRLMTMLQSYLSWRTSNVTYGHPYKPEEDPWRHVARNQPKSHTSRLPASRVLEEVDLSALGVRDHLDNFSLTMGIGSLLPDACGCPQFSAHQSLPFHSSL